MVPPFYYMTFAIIMNVQTVALSDAVASIYFIAKFCVASIQERLLIEGGIY